MARLEQLVTSIVEMFVEHSDGDGKLSKDELKKLIETEIQNPEIKAKLCSADLNKIMEKADKDGDGELSFREFAKLVGFMAKWCYHKKTGHACGECEK